MRDGQSPNWMSIPTLPQGVTSGNLSNVSGGTCGHETERLSDSSYVCV